MTGRAFFLFLLSMFFCAPAMAQYRLSTDTSMVFTPSNPNLIHTQIFHPSVNAWGIDILFSNNGFGLGGFYRHEITDEYSWMVNFLVSGVKADAEVEQYDIFGNSFIPGKLNRALLMPLMVSVQYRLFRDDIADNFRPFITAGVGPTMVYVSPYATYDSTGYPQEIDFFTSLKYGKMRYTLGAFVGAGAYFGMDKGTLTGLNVRYVWAPFPSGIEIMQGGYMKNFGGLFITLTFGSLF
jgi:outer membrane protein W